MKMVKKVLLGLAAGALVLGLAGCKGITVGGDDSVDGEVIKGTTAKAYLGDKDGEGYTNSSDDWVREMQLFSTKHYGAFAALTLTDENKTQAAGATNGVIGFVFNYTENPSGTVNFAIVGYRHYGSKLQTYISQFYNIDKKKFSANNFDCTAKKTAFDESVTTPYEIEILKGDTETFCDLSFAEIDDDGNTTIGVEVIANAKDEDYGAGSYTVNYYAADQLANYKLKANQTPKKAVPILQSVTGYDKKTQTKIGCYVNVYKHKTLNGFWRFSSIKGEDLPVEGFED